VKKWKRYSTIVVAEAAAEVGHAVVAISVVAGMTQALEEIVV
jgi:hypothetical protein